MPGKKADVEAFANRWANKGNENQDTQRFWIDFYQNVLGVEDAVSRLEFEKPVSTAASTHEGYIDVFIPSAKTLVEQKSLGIDLAKAETRAQTASCARAVWDSGPSAIRPSGGTRSARSADPKYRRSSAPSREKAFRKASISQLPGSRRRHDAMQKVYSARRSCSSTAQRSLVS